MSKKIRFLMIGNTEGVSLAWSQWLRTIPRELAPFLAADNSQAWLRKSPTHGRYRLGEGYSISVAFLKLFEKVYAPLTAGLLAPFRGDRLLVEEKRCQLDRLYQCICDDLDALL